MRHHRHRHHTGVQVTVTRLGAGAWYLLKRRNVNDDAYVAVDKTALLTYIVVGVNNNINNVADRLCCHCRRDDAVGATVVGV